MIDLLTAQFPSIHDAAEALSSRTVREYTDLRRLLGDDGPGARADFEKNFSRYYGLNAAGITRRFHEVYFERLYALRGKAVDDSIYGQILRDLYEIPRYKGDRALPCSFVSKLVAIHDESRPLFDRYVGQFFGVGAPQSASLDLRIAGFVSNLATIRANYRAWTEDARFLTVLGRLQDRIPELQNCHLARACDFLAWQAGKLASDRKRGFVVA